MQFEQLYPSRQHSFGKIKLMKTIPLVSHQSFKLLLKILTNFVEKFLHNRWLDLSLGVVKN
eukprot:UN10059